MRDMMAQAEADGERGEDAACAACRNESFDFLGYTIGRVLLAADGPRLPGHATVAEEDRRGVCASDQRDDRPNDGCGPTSRIGSRD